MKNKWTDREVISIDFVFGEQRWQLTGTVTGCGPGYKRKENTRHQLHYLSTTKTDKLRDEERAKSTEGGIVAFAQKQEKPWKWLWRYIREGDPFTETGEVTAIHHQHIKSMTTFHMNIDH